MPSKQELKLRVLENRTESLRGSLAVPAASLPDPNFDYNMFYDELR